jgi:hypothetical protein
MAMLKKKDGDKKLNATTAARPISPFSKGEMKSAPKKTVKSESSPKRTVKVIKSKLTKKGPVSSAKPKMQKTPWILKQTTGVDSMPSLEGKSKQYRDSVTMETYKKGGYRIK